MTRPAAGGRHDADEDATTPRLVKQNVWMRTRTPSPSSSLEDSGLPSPSGPWMKHKPSAASSPSAADLRLRTPSPDNSYAAWKGCAHLPQHQLPQLPQPHVFFAPMFLAQAPLGWMVPAMPQEASAPAASSGALELPREPQGSAGQSLWAPQRASPKGPAPVGPVPAGNDEVCALQDEAAVPGRTRRSGRRGRRGRRGKKVDPEAAALDDAEDKADETDSQGDPAEAQPKSDSGTIPSRSRSRSKEPEPQVPESPDESAEQVPRGTVSEGSRGHPHSCAAACKYVKKLRGCKDGVNCTRCHLCVWCGEPRHARGRQGLAGDSPTPPEEGSSTDDKDGLKDLP